MGENLVLGKSFASASGVALIRNGEIVEFFPQTSGDLGLSGNEIVLTKSDEAELTEALRDFVSKMKVINQRIDASQKEIERLSDKSAERRKRFEIAMQKLEGLIK
ncbi:MAG: Atg14 domain-containing protein [Acidobacteriota bacterium]|nr:Atg14 domain-containing protein [Acidobacteriota bacterium]